MGASAWAIPGRFVHRMKKLVPLRWIENAGNMPPENSCFLNSTNSKRQSNQTPLTLMRFKPLFSAVLLLIFCRRKAAVVLRKVAESSSWLRLIRFCLSRSSRYIAVSYNRVGAKVKSLNRIMCKSFYIKMLKQSISTAAVKAIKQL